MTAFPTELNMMPIVENLNVIPLGVYSMLLGMDWRYAHRTKFHYFEKLIKCLDEKTNKVTLILG